MVKKTRNKFKQVHFYTFSFWFLSFLDVQLPNKLSSSLRPVSLRMMNVTGELSKWISLTLTQLFEFLFLLF